ncbi:MAG: hypothetical protein ACRCU3_08390 [Eubacteriaceae bacterium]
MKRWNRIPPFEVFYGIIDSFLLSCGFTLLMFFFTDPLDVSKGAIKSVVITVFSFLLMIYLFYKIFIKTTTCVDQSPNFGVAIRGASALYEKNKELAEYNLNHAAIHESGHALMSSLKNIESFDVNISYTSSCVVSITKNMNAEAVKNQILILYAGAIAEELILGEFHFGCIGYANGDGDFLRATDLIKTYIIMEDHSKSKALLESELSDEIIRLSKEFYCEGKEILTEHLDQLNLIIRELKKKKHLSKNAIQELIKDNPCR